MKPILAHRSIRVEPRYLSHCLSSVPFQKTGKSLSGGQPNPRSTTQVSISSAVRHEMAPRLQQEERGHWSAEWIPPFPTDDTEAQDFARARYLWIYYVHTYGEKLDTPEYEKEAKKFDKALSISSQMRNIIVSYPYGARKSDLMKLMWPGQETPISVWGDGTVDPTPSEYFGDPEMRAFLKEQGAWDY